MTTSLEATVVLCDSAQVAGDKLHVLGGGWTRIPANAPGFVAVGIIVHVPYDMTNRQLSLGISLLDEDGVPVVLEENEVRARAEFEVGRPPGVKQGEQMSVPIAIPFYGLVLPPGGYVFEVSVGDSTLGRRPFRAY